MRCNELVCVDGMRGVHEGDHVVVQGEGRVEILHRL